MTTSADLLAAVRAAGLLSPERGVVVLLSGGRDSTCLLDLAVTVAGRENVATLHLNYRLRDEAEDDEQHCRALCEALGVRLRVVSPGAPPGSGNLQAWARAARYAAAEELAGQQGGWDIAAGHTASDQLETVLYRLISSPSRRALLGMRARDGRLVRPLLGFTREQTSAYCRQRGLAWRDDASNDTGKYVRNRIRNELVPLIRELHPGAEGNILALAEVLRLEAGVLDEEIEKSLAGRTAMPLGELRALPQGLVTLVIQQLADLVTAPAPAAGVARRTAEILGMGDDAHLDLPGGVRATTEGGVLRFGPTPRHNQCR